MYSEGEARQTELCSFLAIILYLVNKLETEMCNTASLLNCFRLFPTIANCTHTQIDTKDRAKQRHILFSCLFQKLWEPNAIHNSGHPPQKVQCAFFFLFISQRTNIHLLDIVGFILAKQWLSHVVFCRQRNLLHTLLMESGWKRRAAARWAAAQPWMCTCQCCCEGEEKKNCTIPSESYCE